MADRERTTAGLDGRGRWSGLSALPGGNLGDDRDTPELVNAVGMLASTVVLGVAAGVPGVVVGVALWLVSFRLRPIFVFAAGQLALLALFPEAVPTGRLVLVEAGLLGTLAGSVVRTPHPKRTVGGFLAAFLGFGALLHASRLLGHAVWSSGALLIASVAILSYVLYRYELLLRGLVGGGIDE